MRLITTCGAAALLMLPGVALQAQAGGQTKEGETEFIKAAEEGAPPRIAEKAAIARVEPKGKATTLRPGNNGFTCTLMPDESHAPFCGDQKGFQWMIAAISEQPRPPAAGGIVYMAKGAVHYETPKGEIVMRPTAETKEVKEPPHWMLLIPMNPATTGIPARPNAGGSYIMFAGTPYAHLMIYQDPKMLKD
jgi:hypothetical protein